MLRFPLPAEFTKYVLKRPESIHSQPNEYTRSSYFWQVYGSKAKNQFGAKIFANSTDGAVRRPP